jgi:glycosyltransferase involved in cell wall biosynthesis
VGDIEHPAFDAFLVGMTKAEARLRTPRRPKLLFLCQTLPFPPDGGVLIRTYNVLRLLAREFDVTALCFYRSATHPTDQRVRDSAAALAPLAKVHVFPIPQEHSKVRLVFDHLRSTLKSRAYTVFAYDSADFRNKLREAIASTKFDLVHVDSLDLVGYLPELGDLPVVCVHHNVESSLLRRRASTSSGIVSRYMAMQARLTEEEERRWCKEVDLNVAVSPIDRDSFIELAPDSRFTVVPNGVDTHGFRPAGADVEVPEGIVFVGGFTWQPNRDAMEFFCRSILPAIRERGVNPSVTWVGRAPADIVREYKERYGVHLTGYVDDIRPIVTRAACYVAPLLSGGGTRLKILDAWAMGKAVVSTAVGCEGLDARDGENILIRDSAQDFADGVIEVLTNTALRERLEDDARETAVQTYDWEVIGRPMLERYHEVYRSREK